MTGANGQVQMSMPVQIVVLLTLLTFLPAIIMSLSSEHPTAAWQLLTLLRLDGDLAATPVILCTPDLRMATDKLARLGALRCEVLEEPFTEHGLLAKVQTIFSRLVGRDSGG